MIAILIILLIFFISTSILIAKKKALKNTGMPIVVSIEKGYEVWKPSNMKTIIDYCVGYLPMKQSEYTILYIEWWIHNIGYYVTKPFTFIPKINAINKRFETVDLEVWPAR